MPKPTGPANTELQRVISGLRKSSVAEYRTVAELLMKPRRSKEGVNIHTIAHVAENSSNIIVPWKVLGGGGINRPVRVFSFAFSEKAKASIEKAGGSCHQLQELLKEEPGHVIVLRDIASREE